MFPGVICANEINMDNKTKVLLTGGGTLGPVTPLLALAEVWNRRDPLVEFHWIGTPKGPEQELIEKEGIQFLALSTPKLDRHRIWQWPFILPHLIFSCFKAYKMLQKIKPDIIFTAGGYVSIPVFWMAWFLGIPTWVHQLDVTPGMANKLMAPFARRVSVTWEDSASGFSEDKVLIVGGIARSKLERGSAVSFEQKYKLDDSKPTLFVTGGGTGAQVLNEAMEVIGRDLVKTMNVVHLTGKGKMIERLKEIPGYIIEEFFTDDMPDAFNAADVVVSRAGMGTILALITLKKPTILIPIANSHQEENARVLKERNAIVTVKNFSPQLLKQEIEKLMNNPDLRKKLSKRIEKALTMDATEKIINVAEGIIRK